MQDLYHLYIWCPLILLFHQNCSLPPYFSTSCIGAYDDPNGSHVSIEVTSALFEGKRPVQRQQLVYKALWEGMLHNISPLHSGRLFRIGSDMLLLLTSTEFINI